MSKPSPMTKRAKTDKFSKPALTLPVFASETQRVALNRPNTVGTTVVTSPSGVHQVLALVEVFTRQPYSRSTSLLLDMAVIAFEQEVQP